MLPIVVNVIEPELGGTKVYQTLLLMVQQSPRYGCGSFDSKVAFAVLPLIVVGIESETADAKVSLGGTATGVGVGVGFATDTCRLKFPVAPLNLPNWRK